MFSRARYSSSSTEAWTYELKLDGFRALVDTHDGLRVLSRRGWNMTDKLPELRGLPDSVTLDGELVARGEDDLPSFSDLCTRMLHGTRRWVAVTYYAFDLLRLHGETTMELPLSERRYQLDALDLGGPACRVAARFDDGEALFWAVCDRGLEGVVAKKQTERYRPGERRWIKAKNAATGATRLRLRLLSRSGGGPCRRSRRRSGAPARRAYSRPADSAAPRGRRVGPESRRVRHRSCRARAGRANVLLPAESEPAPFP
jgi:ATP-dependent DNA ligase